MASPDWRVDLMKAHPRLFRIMPEKPARSFGYPLCKAGWSDVLVRLCNRIENALRFDETFQFVRIKQKFGIARIDWDGEMSDETRLRIGDAINLAVARSAAPAKPAEPRATCTAAAAGLRHAARSTRRAIRCHLERASRTSASCDARRAIRTCITRGTTARPTRSRRFRRRRRNSDGKYRCRTCCKEVTFEYQTGAACKCGLPPPDV